MSFVSIGITAYNEEKNIGKLLDFLSKEKFSFSLKEIIVVISGCTDRTEDVVKPFLKTNKKIKLIKEKERKGKTSAINLILKKAKGNIIVFICADNIPKKGSINKIITRFSNKKIQAVSGRPIPIEGKDKLFGYISYLVWALHHKVCLRNPKISGELFAIKKDVVKEIPYKIVNDDGYLTALVRKLGYKIAYAPEAVTYMIGTNNLSSHIIRRRRIGRGYTQLKEIGLDVNISIPLKIKSIIEFIKEEPENIHKILFAVFLEVFIDILAFYDTIKKINPYCWKK